MTISRDSPPHGRSRARLLAVVASLLLFTASTSASEGQLGHKAPDAPSLLPLLVWPAVALLASAIAALAYLLKKPKANPPEPSVPARLSSRQLTQSFTAAIPTLTRQLNLEVATTTQTEVLERLDTRSLLWGWLGLGTNQAQIKVPVTYRYHLRLREPWRLELAGDTLCVTAPPLRASLPPAIHTERMEVWTSRGWARLSPTDLLARLHRDLTPTLCEFATDPRHLDLVRETCRQSVAEFVRRWLEGQGPQPQGQFTAIDVRFADEPRLPPPPAGKLLEP